MVYVHRLSFSVFVGPIQSGLQIDHLCRTPCCCNPIHLEAVTPSTNVTRGLGPQRLRERHAAITHCPHGHEYTEENTRHYRGNRYCWTCNITKQRRQRQAKRKIKKP